MSVTTRTSCRVGLAFLPLLDGDSIGLFFRRRALSRSGCDGHRAMRIAVGQLLCPTLLFLGRDGCAALMHSCGSSVKSNSQMAMGHVPGSWSALLYVSDCHFHIRLDSYSVITVTCSRTVENSASS